METIPKISACIIAYNAENTIVNCLNSIKDYCSEIIIALDTKTTDETRQRIIDFARDNNPDDIHRGLEDNGKQIGKVKYYDFEWVNDSFADARNYAGSKVTMPWTFVIDTDEVALNPVIPDNTNDAYCVKVISTVNGVKNTVFPSTRLYKSDIGIKFIMSTHESNHESLIGKKVVDSDMVILSVEKTEKALKKKTIWLLERAKRELITESWNEYLYGQIGTYHQTLENYTESLKWLHRAMFKNISNVMKAQGAIRIFINYQALDNTDCDNAMWWLHLSIALCPAQLQAHHILYQIYKNDDMPDYAELHKQAILKIGNKSKLPFDMVFENINF